MHLLPTFKYGDLTNPYAFRRLFGKEENKAILTALLNAVLGKQFAAPLTEVTFLKTVPTWRQQ